jgi:hypothetical protein
MTNNKTSNFLSKYFFFQDRSIIFVAFMAMILYMTLCSNVIAQFFCDRVSKEHIGVVYEPAS